MLALLVLGWRFAARNEADVPVDLLLTQLPATPLWTVLLVAFGLGAVLVGLLSSYEIMRLSLLQRRLRKTVERLESEIHQLRNLPLAGDGSEGAGGEHAAPIRAASRDG
jgi:uncharacterized integral membrane protein